MEKYLDESLSFEERAADLVSRMTIQECGTQMLHAVKAVERLGVKEYNWWNEALHGVARCGMATLFPQAIGMAASVSAGQSMTASVTVTNTGSMDSDTVAEFYLKDVQASVTVPKYRLCGFRHIDVKAGQSEEITVQIPAEMFTVVTGDGERIFESGEFVLYAGGSRPDHRSETLTGTKPLRTIITLQ